MKLTYEYVENLAREITLGNGETKNVLGNSIFSMTGTELLKFAELVVQDYRKERKKDRRETKSKLGYSRVGLKNI